MSTKIQVRLVRKQPIRAFTLEAAKSRAHKFTRVADEFYLTCDAHLQEFIRSHVRRLPSKGKTIQ